MGCAGGSTGVIPAQSPSQCVKYCGNNVVLDDCGVCGGNNRLKDCDGICYGSNFDCRNGNSEKDPSKQKDSSEEEHLRDLYMIIGTIIILMILLIYNCIRSWRRYLRAGQVQNIAQPNRQDHISANVLATMPTISYCSDGPELPYGSSMCAICICDFEDEDILRKAPCGHHFHQECIDRWFSMNRFCPVCKADASGTQGANSDESEAAPQQQAVTIEMTRTVTQVIPRPPIQWPGRDARRRATIHGPPPPPPPRPRRITPAMPRPTLQSQGRGTGRRATLHARPVPPPHRNEDLRRQSL